MATFVYPPYPTVVTVPGVATEATLSALNAKIPGPLGQKTMANSLSVTIASDQSPVAVSFTPSVTDFGATTSAQRVAAVIGNTTGQAAFASGASSAQTLRVIPATDTSLSQLPTTLGQKTSANSLAVVIASDQSNVNVALPGIGINFGATNVALRTAAQIGNTTGAADFASGASSAQTLRVIPATDTSFSQLPSTLGQKTMAGSTGVVIASDQSAIPTTISGSAVNYGAATAALRTASQIGNTTGQADFNSGTTSAQTLRTIIATDSNLAKAAQLPSALGQTTMAGSTSVVIASDQSIVNVSLPGIGVNFGNSNVALRTAAQIGNATGAADFGAGSTSAQTIRTVIASDTTIGSAVFNYGAATAAVRVAAQIGNASAVADFNSGTTSAQTLRVVPVTDSNLAKAAQFPTTLGVTTAANSLSVALATDQQPLSTNAKPRYSRVQAPVLVDAVNIAASGGTRYLVATAAAEITRLFLRDATGLFINWYSASSGGTLLFQTGPGVEVPLDIVIANGTTLYVESATSTAGSSGAYLSVNFLS